MAEYEDDTAEPAPAQEAVPPQQMLAMLMASPNIVPSLDEETLSTIGRCILDDYEIDKASRYTWLKRNAEAMKLAMMVAEEKSYPFDGASNVKWPLITIGALQFNARAYPAIVQGDQVVKCKTRGRDPQGMKAARARRVSEHMSDQLLNDMPEWEEDTDRITVQIAIEGCRFRKVFYDTATRRNVTRNLSGERLVVNMGARSLTDAPRITEKLPLYPCEIEERIRDGRYIEFDYKAQRTADDDKETTSSTNDDEDAGYDDKDGPQLFLEQHRLYDLDGDGYPEPYICTLHYGSSQVVRIVANFDEKTVRFTEDGRVASIRRRDYYVKYPFMPNPEGGFYDVGLGWLLSSTNEAINTSLNQMFDAGHMANMQGGLIASVMGMKERRMEFTRGEWKIVNTNGMPLNQAVYPIKYDPPSEVLFKLLGLLIESGEQVASIKDVLSGEVKQNMQPTTVLALIEQGLQVFTAIYKRLHRSLKAELQMLARLNAENVTPEDYAKFFDEEVDPKADYDLSDLDILPISDPQAVTKMQKIAKSEALAQIAAGNPMINQGEVTARRLEAIEIEDIEKLIQPPDPTQEAFMKVMQRLEVEGRLNEVAESFTKALKNVADAEAAEEGLQVPWADMYLKALQAELSAEQQQNAQLAGQGGLPSMDGTPDGSMGAVPPQGAGDGTGSIGAGPVVPDGGVAPGPMGGPAGAGGIPQGAL